MKRWAKPSKRSPEWKRRSGTDREAIDFTKANRTLKISSKTVFCLSLALALALSRDDGTRLQAQRGTVQEQSSVDRGANTPPRDRASTTPAGPRSLRQGTPLLVRTPIALSTRTHKAGQFFTAHLDQSLVVDGLVIAPQGAELRGLVVDSHQGGRVKGRSSLAVQMTHLHIAAGPTIAVSTTTYTVVANATKGRDDAVKVGIGSGVGAAIGAILGGGKGSAIGATAGAGAGVGAGPVLATHGDAAVIPGETVLQFTLNAPAALLQSR